MSAVGGSMIPAPPISTVQNLAVHKRSFMQRLLQQVYAPIRQRRQLPRQLQTKQ